MIHVYHEQKKYLNVWGTTSLDLQHLVQVRVQYIVVFVLEFVFYLDELKKKISEGYSVLRSKLLDDLKPREEIWNSLQVASYQGDVEKVHALLTNETASEKTDTGLSLLHIACIGTGTSSLFFL